MNRMNIVSLGVNDMAKSIQFYRDELGFKTDEKENNPNIIFLILLEQNCRYIQSIY